MGKMFLRGVITEMRFESWIGIIQACCGRGRVLKMAGDMVIKIKDKKELTEKRQLNIDKRKQQGTGCYRGRLQ